jgi:PTH1 family peptidyl-tRNA hydrolase
MYVENERHNMLLFVGLGNPGSKYASNRHNIGFMALDKIAEHNRFSPWRNKFQAKLSEGMLGGKKVILLKPQTFMNLSGQSVGDAMRFYKLTPSDITVFHDELDIAPGKCRVKMGGGHAGHNGLRSIHQHIGPDYQRIRLGIGHPGHKDRVAQYVLGDFAKADQQWINDILQGVGKGSAKLAVDDSAGFMNAIALQRQQNLQNTQKEDNKINTQSKQVQNQTSDDRTAVQKLIDKFK